MIRYLTLPEVLYLHERLLEQFGGRAGVRDLGALDSSLAQPASGAFGEERHPDLCAKAAAYLFHLARNHPFLDGNKRIAWNAAVLFLRLNGVVVDVDQDVAADFVLRVATGDADKDEIRQTLAGWQRAVDENRG